MNVFFSFSRYYYDFRIHHSTMRVYIAAENGTCIKTIASQFLFLVRTRHHFVADQLTHNEQRWVAISVFVLFFLLVCLFIAFQIGPIVCVVMCLD